MKAITWLTSISLLLCVNTLYARNVIEIASSPDIFTTLVQYPTETTHLPQRTPLTEATLGYQNLVFTNARGGPAYNVSPIDLFKALAKTIPTPAGGIIPNPHHTWRDISGHLPIIKIQIVGPTSKSSNYRMLLKTIMEEGCLQFRGMRQLKFTDSQQFSQICHTIRNDEHYIALNNDEQIFERLNDNPNHLGILSYDFYTQYTDYLRPNRLNGLKPSLGIIK